MNKNTKALLGVLSFVPLATLIAYIIFFVRFFFRIAQDAQGPQQFDEPAAFFVTFIPLFVVLGIGSLVALFLFIYYIYCSIKDVSATENDKLLWVLLIVFLSYLAFPLYWFIRIWDNPNFSTKEEGLDAYDN